MANNFDYPRFSTHVSSIVDRKLRTISQSITGSTGYFRKLIRDAAQSAADALTSETNAKTSETNVNDVWEDFTSLYLGVKATDPTKSNLNLPITKGAFHIKESNQRLRVAIAIAPDGTPTWADAQVRADYDTVVEAGENVFLFLHKANQLQVVDGPVAFNNKTTAPYVSSWTDNEVVNAKAAVDKIDEAKTVLNQAIVDARTALQQNIDGINNSLNVFAGKFSSGGNENGSWERRPGVIEQWGVGGYSANNEPVITVNLPIGMPDGSYNVTAVGFISGSSIAADTWVQLISSSKGTNSFQIQYQLPGGGGTSPRLDGFEWRIIGRVPNGF